MYSFLFDRRSMALLLTGMAVAGLLLFAGGVLVGLQLQLDGSAPVTVAQFRPLGPSQPAGPPQSEPPASPPPAQTAPVGTGSGTSEEADPQPAEPAASTEPPAARPPAIAEPPATLVAQAPEGPETDLPEQQIVLTAEPAGETPARTAVLEDLSAAPQAVPASLVPPARPGAAPAEEPARSTADETVPVLTHGELADADGEPTFGVQVAAFELRSTASRIAAELTRRGWDAYLVPFETPSGRRMYSIRFGRYSDGGEAYRAAREFERREKAPTLVRLQLRED